MNLCKNFYLLFFFLSEIYDLYQEDAPKPGQPGQAPRPAGAAAAPRA